MAYRYWGKLKNLEFVIILLDGKVRAAEICKVREHYLFFANRTGGKERKDLETLIYPLLPHVICQKKFWLKRSD